MGLTINKNFLRVTPKMTPPSPAEGRKVAHQFVRPDRPETIRTILVVDDDKQVLRITAKQLEKFGLQVITVNPDESIKNQALDIVVKEQIDLIFMDGQMPGTSGPEIITDLRKNSFSGYIAANTTLPDVQDEMLAAGADFKNPDKVDSFPFFKSLFVPR